MCDWRAPAKSALVLLLVLFVKALLAIGEIHFAALDIGGFDVRFNLQRIAVDSEHRRRGIARDLVVDALRWMHHDRRSRCLVNTGLDNSAALALYEGLGFERLSDVLTIAERRIPE